MLPLVVLFGATGSGKTALSLALAERVSSAAPAEIISCDSVAVYRHMELGTAKPSTAERALVQHHCLDLYEPDQTCTAGDYARHAREALRAIGERKALPFLCGGTGLYLRALLDGLFPAPSQNPQLRELLRQRAAKRGAEHLHRTLKRLDRQAAALIHAHDVPKVIRAIEVSLAANEPMSKQWEGGRDKLEGYRILRLGLDPPRAELYHRINARAAAMFHNGLVEETRGLIERFGPDCRPLASLGYAQAMQVLSETLTLHAAVAETQQGHRNYAKRQATWFRREGELHPVHWLKGTGDSPEIIAEATAMVERHLAGGE